MQQIPRVVIAAASSGCGKTTVVTGLLRALRQRGLAVGSFKIGPDYIDPGYHRLASGKESHNIDTWLMSKATMQNIFLSVAKENDFSIVEGVMGLYDGGKKNISSTAEIAKALKAPVILVIDCRSMGASAAAIALGYREYDRDVNFAGVILNRLGSENHANMICEGMEKLNIPVLGKIFRNENYKMPERHLGLLPVEENNELAFIDELGEAMEAQLDIEAILQIAKNSQPLEKVQDEAEEYLLQVREGRRRSYPDDYGEILIGVARDEAFSFYYAESLAVLESLGGKIVEFSPLRDKELPPVDGLIFGGGFPEMFAGRLQANDSMLRSIRQAAWNGMPIYGECGGYMYLTEGLWDFDGNFHEMLGLLPGQVKMNKRLQMVGYVEGNLQENSILGEKGSKIKGHEFHFSSEAEEANVSRPFVITRARNGASYEAGAINQEGNVFGSYLHLHFAGCPQAATAFVRSCWNYKLKK